VWDCEKVGHTFGGVHAGGARVSVATQKTRWRAADGVADGKRKGQGKQEATDRFPRQSFSHSAVAVPVI
jgi:hypothetical protein